MLIRTLVFNVVFYLNFIVLGIVLSPVLLLPSRYVLRVAKFWAGSNLWWHRLIVGVGEDIGGVENIPQGAALIASKHHSVWETMRLFTLLPRPAYILKRELMWIPLFGWYLIRTGMIPVDRGKRSAALKSMTDHARKAVTDERQIIIFPEGTRMSPGAPPQYKYGVVHLYCELGVPVVPVALNAGLYWPRRTFEHRKGVIALRFLPPIAPGLDAKRFSALLQTTIEDATQRLLGVAPPSEPRASDRSVSGLSRTAGAE